MMNIVLSEKVRQKLMVKHMVRGSEIWQCFQNREGIFLTDEREDNKTDPPTLWFIAETDNARILKIVFVYAHGKLHIKTAYQANQVEISIYERHGK
jgi:uncharacterized DUF497 family protein